MSHVHHVYAFYLPGVETIRRPAIQMELNNLDQGAPMAVKSEPDPITAIAEAVQQRTKMDCPVTVIGALRDLVPSDEHVTESLWQQSVLHVLQDAGITFVPLDATKRKISRMRGQESEWARAYHHARLVLKDELERRLAKKVIGRPPYGYMNVDGNLQLNKDYRSAIKTVFSCIRKRWAPSLICEHMQQNYPNERKVNPKTGHVITKRQFWSTQKIRRIHQRINLYTLGEYVGRDGKTYIDRNLACLPAEWADTPWPTEPTPSSEKEAS